jgi:2-dehydro-3-deoxyphosphogluconate aldolase/(4S)-4-hydroxy-2-oxoglutarate aldolase
MLRKDRFLLAMNTYLFYHKGTANVLRLEYVKETFPFNQSIIVTLDVDTLLFERLQQIIQVGFSTVQINSTDSSLLKQLLQTFPNLRIGAGNIHTTQQLENVYQAGVHFAFSPGCSSAILQTAAVYNFALLAGVATITEAMKALELGYDQVRPYPSTVPFCTLLHKCLPGLHLFPEVEYEEIEHYLSLPSVTAVSMLNPDAKAFANRDKWNIGVKLKEKHLHL